MGLDIWFYKQNKKEAELAKAKNIPIEAKIVEMESRDSELSQEEIEELRNLYEELENPKKEVAYFRKVNFLVRFFDYQDDCSDQVISKCEVEDLIAACNAVLKKAKSNPDNWQEFADDELPTVSGFFFGSTEYGEY